MAERVRLNITLAKDLDDTLDALAREAGVNKSDVFRQAVALLKAAHEARKTEGLQLALTRDGQKVEARFVGLI